MSSIEISKMKKMLASMFTAMSVMLYASVKSYSLLFTVLNEYVGPTALSNFSDHTTNMC